ncbi:hypothetical protein AAFN60_18175 [Roseibacillus persicicus]|uniref:hypothetical protein n=1 Tax=Roseibacillus persicicus TaxID=454148 RepID=UPI00398BB487
MSQLLVATLVVGVCLLGVWTFAVLLQEERYISGRTDISAPTVTSNELLSEGAGSERSSVIGVSEVHRVRVMPFSNTIPGFHLSPHRFPAMVGVVSSILLFCAFLWCLLVPRTLASGAAWKETDDTETIAPEVMLIDSDDEFGSFVEQSQQTSPRQNNAQHHKSDRAGELED